MAKENQYGVDLTASQVRSLNGEAAHCQRRTLPSIIVCLPVGLS
jgi:hypothetical protein